jgi:transcriptional regulator with XRE-family HTH domain
VELGPIASEPMGWRTKLIRARKLAGLTQDQVAAALGLTRQAYGAYEKAEGGSKPDVEQVGVIARLLGVPVAWWLDDSQPDDQPAGDMTLALELIRRLGLDEALRRLMAVAPPGPLPEHPRGVRAAATAPIVLPDDNAGGGAHAGGVDVPTRPEGRGHKPPGRKK